MSRCRRVAAVGFVLSFGLWAQEPGKTAPESGGDMTVWLWVNFALLVAGLGYLTSKTLPAFLRARQESISKGIDEAARKKKEAEERAADIDRRLAGIGQEIDGLRGEIQREMQAESRRVQEETERLVRRVEDQAKQEIGFVTKSALQELRSYSADLALNLASERIAHQMDKQVQHALVDDFVADLRQQG